MSKNTVTTNPKVGKKIQDAVDEYLALHSQYKQLERKLESLKEVIQPYMVERGIKSIEGTMSGKVELGEQYRAQMTSKYTSYSLDVVQPHLTPDIIKICVVKVVDGEMLEAMIKSGKVKEEVKGFKITSPVVQFRTTH